MIKEEEEMEEEEEPKAEEGTPAASPEALKESGLMKLKTKLTRGDWLSNGTFANQRESGSIDCHEDQR